MALELGLQEPLWELQRLGVGPISSELAGDLYSVLGLCDSVFVHRVTGAD